MFSRPNVINSYLTNSTISAPVPMKISNSWDSSSWLILPLGSIHLPRTIAKIKIWWNARWILSSESVHSGVVELSKIGSSQLVRLVVEHSNASPKPVLPTDDKKNNTFWTTVVNSSIKLYKLWSTIFFVQPWNWYLFTSEMFTLLTTFNLVC